MRGMTRSEITIAGLKDVTLPSASSPSVAESATKPQLLTSCSRPTRAAGSSSTMSTRSATCLAVDSVDVGDSPAVVIVTQHLNHVIFTFCARQGMCASSTFRTPCRNPDNGGFFAQSGDKPMKNHNFTPFPMLCAAGLCAATLACGGGSSTPVAAKTVSEPAGTTPKTAASATNGADSSALEREITIPSGTSLAVTLDSAVGSDISTVAEAVSGHLSHAVTVGGETVLPAGSKVAGVVTDATRSGRVKGLAHVAVRFNSVEPAHEDAKYRMTTATVQRTAQATKKKDAAKIGGAAAGGALIGAIAGGGKGALIGTAVGGGAGTAVVMSTRGDEVHLAKGSALTVKLSEPLTIRVRG